jgi:UDP-GlcNAc:undecaprenyl-phosphate GlcNAc-1-phosphate transferase
MIETTAFILSYLLVAVLTPALDAVSRRFGISMDAPGDRKIHKSPTPRVGGIAIALSFFITLSLAPIFNNDIKGFMLGALVIVIVGLIEDINPLSSFTRFFAQSASVIILLSFGISVTFLPGHSFGKVLEYAVTFLWIVGLTNAFNFLDGMDGLASGLGVVSAACFGFIAFQTRQSDVLLLNLLVLGCCLGFLPYNLKKARGFLGDLGSTFIGFTLAVIAVIGTWAKSNVAALSVPILILGVPIFDMVFTTVTRIWTGKVKNIAEWFDYAGTDHFHHSLVELGLRPMGAVFFIFSVNALLGIGAVVLMDADCGDAFLLLSQGFILFCLIAVLMIVGKRHKNGWKE